MAEVRLKISDDIVSEFQSKLGSNMKATDIAREAMSLYNWAIEERAKGRILLSTNTEGKDVTRLAMPSLDRIKKL